MPALYRGSRATLYLRATTTLDWELTMLLLWGSSIYPLLLLHSAQSSIHHDGYMQSSRVHYHDTLERLRDWRHSEYGCFSRSALEHDRLDDGRCNLRGVPVM